MTKQSPRRSTGFRLVHVIQTLLWLAICICLLYQVKHFYDNKKIYVQSFVKMSENGVLHLGRKHLHIERQDKIRTKMDKHKESEDADEEEEQEQVSEEVEDLIDEEDRETEEQDTD